MSKNPKQVKPQELKQDAQDLKDEANSMEDYSYTDTTFCPVWNETFKRYDMLTIRINRNSEKCFVDKREATRYDTNYRALDDLIKRISDFFIKGEK